MEQHPIPQNVTTFQFRLIGDMTIKQFGFLAGGAIAGYICYKLPLPFIITLPLAALSVLTGVGLAFVPVEERPMDVWILSFIKSIYSPTLYIWQKTPLKEASTPDIAQTTSAKKAPNYGQFGAIPGLREAMAISESIETYLTKTTTKSTRPASPFKINTPSPPATPSQSESQVRDAAGQPHVLATLENLFVEPPRPTPTPLSKPELPEPIPDASGASLVLTKTRRGFFEWLANFFLLKGASYEPREPVLPVSTTSLTGKPFDLTPPQSKKEMPPPTDVQKVTNEAAELQKTVDDLKKQLEGKTTSETRILELQKQLMDAIAHREKMERELTDLRRKAVDKNPVPLTASYTAPNTTIASQQSTVRVVTPGLAPKMGLPRLTTFPNVVTGLVKDNEANLLPGVLITVRDKDDVPLRALKSNKLGQFASPMPLPNGTYFIEVEDPRERYVFDRAQITLNGNVMPPLEIIAKSQKQIARAKLEKEIFGNQM